MKPCPFCGGTHLETETSNPDREGIPMNEKCMECGACGPWLYDVPDVDCDALALGEWDTRVNGTKEQCPFCGGTDLANQIITPLLYRVTCDECAAGGPVVAYPDVDGLRATLAWQRRVGK